MEESTREVDLSAAAWRKSSYCNANGCVEVAFADDLIAVRDSKHPDGSALIFSLAEWRAFVRGTRNGEFDPDQ